MTVLLNTTEDIVSDATSVGIGQYFTVGASGNPAYLVVDAIDRNEYTVAGNGDTGSFSGNGATLNLTDTGDDGRGCGIVFTWQAATHQYTNATYGTLSQLSYTSSDCQGDVTNISLFGTSSESLAQQDAGNAYALMQADAAGYIGSATIVTDPGFSGPPPATATQDGVAAAAMRFVGDAWNQNGCWLLASTIAAEAGASLPVQSTAVGVAGKANGEWVVIYNGPAGTGGSANWQSLVSTGDIIGFVTGSGGGHITTCVSGTGTTAMLVDNITYENARGQITNSANDGSKSDIIVAAPHPASQEWSGVTASTVVIYGLDAPVVSDIAASTNIYTGADVVFSKLFTAADPASHAITKYQAYESQSGDTLTLAGVANTSALSAGTALAASSLTALGVDVGGGGTDTIDVRAFNGTYWGDWQSTTVTATVEPPRAPVLGAQTPNQTWKQATHISLVLAGATFTDPQKQTLTYSAAGTNGAALPSWLSFNPSTRDFSGTVPAGADNFGVVVTATDTSGLSTSETFTVTVPALAPVLAVHAAPPSWVENSAIAFALPQGNFTDPQGESLTYAATEASGAALPSWLRFSGSTLSFSGTAPATAQTLDLKVTATDTSGLSTSESITASIVKASATAADWTGCFVEELSPAASPPAFHGAWSDPLVQAHPMLVATHHA
jgi:hypothetical protein